LSIDAKKGLLPPQVICAVRLRGGTMASIARSVGMSRKTMSWALIKPHPRANAAIAEFLGVPLCEVWPQWFDVDGKLISTAALPRPSVNPIPSASFRSSLSRRTA
jgi:lambda repressor-like predicted transcriptional regulator